MTSFVIVLVLGLVAEKYWDQNQQPGKQRQLREAVVEKAVVEKAAFLQYFRQWYETVYNITVPYSIYAFTTFFVPS